MDPKENKILEKVEKKISKPIILDSITEGGVVNKVKITYDYGKFKNLYGNRQIYPRQLDKLKISMSKKRLDVPILVNENFEVIDGQHTLEVRRSLKWPILYIVMQGYGLKEVQVINSMSKNWGYLDYARSYADLGLEYYILYEKFRKQYGFPHTVNIALLKNVTYLSRSQHDEFREGRFKIQNYQTACDMAERIYKIEPYYKGFKKAVFVLSFIRLIVHEDFDFNVFIGKLKLQPLKLVHCTTINNYIRLIEDIYNYRSSKKVRFF